MSSQKLVRCQVRREGSAGEGSTRYVPMEIFGLWEHLMKKKHGFSVENTQASLWIDMEESPISLTRSRSVNPSPNSHCLCSRSKIRCMGESADIFLRENTSG